MLRAARALRFREFRLLWTGQAISHIGNGVTQVALAWQALELSETPAGLSLVLTARTVPLLVLLLVGGAITDRLPRREILVFSDVVRGTVVTVIAVLALTDSLALWHLVVLAAVFGAGDAFFFPAVGAFVPQLVPRESIVDAAAMESATRPLTMRLAGPALGGLLVATVGTGVAFAVDGVTFALSALCLLRITRREAPPRETQTTVLRDIVEGFRYVRSQAWIWATLLMATGAVMFFVGPSEVLVPKLVKERLGGASTYGLVVSGMGAGGILGAFVAPTLARGRRVLRMYLIWGAAVMFFGALAFAPSIAVAVALMAVVGFGFEIGHVIWNTLLQELVPNRLLGRVRALDYLVSFALMPLSYLAVAPLAGAIGVAETIFWGGTLAGVITFVFLLWPNVLAPDRRGFAPPGLDEPAAAAPSRA